MSKFCLKKHNLKIPNIKIIFINLTNRFIKSTGGCTICKKLLLSTYNIYYIYNTIEVCIIFANVIHLETI